MFVPEMEYFLREYTARSILPHLSTDLVKLTVHRGHYHHHHPASSNNDIRTSPISINSTTTNLTLVGADEGGVAGIGHTGTDDNNLYFIEPQQQLLLDTFSSDDEDILHIDGGGDGYSQNNDYTEYLRTNDSDMDPSSSTSTTAYHLLESLASVTTTTISSITHQLTGQTNDTIHLLHDPNHSINTSVYAVTCEGDCHADAALNDTWSMDEFGGCGDDGEGELSSVYFITAVYLLYIPIFIFALLGNGTVCYIVQSTPRMRTVTNYFIANLAMGDILMSLFCVPSSFISIFILGYWPFGIALCHFVNYSQAVSVLVSAYTLVAISIDRYIAIMWPLRPRITKR